MQFKQKNSKKLMILKNKELTGPETIVFAEVKRLLTLSDDEYFRELIKTLNFKYSFILIKNKRIKRKSIFRKEYRLTRNK